MSPHTLCIHAPSSIGRCLIAQYLPRFLYLHPELRVVLCDTSSVQDDPCVHVAISIGWDVDRDLASDQVGTVQTITCASPEFLEWAGPPDSPWDIRPEQCIAVIDMRTQRSGEWLFRRGSESCTIYPAARLTVGDELLAIAAAVRGGGYVRTCRIHACEQIGAGLLLPVLNDWNDDSQHILLTYEQGSREDRCVQKFRAFIRSILPSGSSLAP